MKIVGLNIGGHDGGCAIVVDGKVCCAIAEERLNRCKYSPGWLNSLMYCLDTARIGIQDVDLFVFSSYGPPLPENFDGGIPRFSHTTAKFTSIDHHLSHAFAAFAFSPYEEALLVVMDGWGNNKDTESYYIGDRAGITRIGGNDPRRPRCKGVGATYEAFTNFLGFTDNETGKLMGLSAYGDPAHFQLPLFEVREERVASRLEHSHQSGIRELALEYNLPLGDYFPAPTSETAWHIASYVQHQTQLAVLQLVGGLIEKTGQTNLCFSGGVALNCLINTAIRQAFRGVQLFPLPFASDTGQAIGNALYGQFLLSGEIPKQPLSHCFFGKTYDEEEILRALKRHPTTTRHDRLLQYRHSFRREESIYRTAAQLLSQGKTIGWFQGGCELGPRALGHRSILADPRAIVMRDVINNRVKNREWFRPFAPSVLEHKVKSFFAVDDLSAFMLDAPKLTADHRGMIPAAAHIDGTARPHIVTQEHDSEMYRLISEFEALTGVPALLNTSFNKAEPIVESPGDALFTFLTTNLDYLIIGDYLVEKEQS